MAPHPKPSSSPTQVCASTYTLPAALDLQAVLQPILPAAISAVAAHVQAPTPLITHHILTLATIAAQRLISVRLPTGAQRPVSCFFATLIGTGEGRDAAEKLIVDAARTWERAAPCGPLNLFYDPRQPRPFRSDDRYRAYTRQSGLFARHPYDVIAPGVNRRVESASLCALWNGKVITSAAAPPLHPRLALHLVTTPRAGRGLFGDADLEDSGLLGRLLVAAPASNIGAREYNAAENEDPPPAFTALLATLGALYPQPASAHTRVIGFSSEAAAAWLAYAREVETAMAPGGALAPIRAFAVHLPEHAARLAAVVALVNDPALAQLSLAQLETGIALARFYTEERLRLFNVAPPALSPAEQEDALREWLQRKHEGKVVTLRDICRSGPKQIRGVDAVYKLMRRMERLGIVQPANDASQGPGGARRVRSTYAWRVESEQALADSTQHVA